MKGCTQKSEFIAGTSGPADVRWFVPFAAMQKVNGETVVTVVRGQERFPLAVTPEGIHGEWTIVRSACLQDGDELLGTTATFVEQ